MHKEPFVITLANDDLPNLADDGGDNFGVEFSKTKLWQEDSTDIINILYKISDKLDVIIKNMK